MKSRNLSLALIGLVVGLMLKSAVATLANSMSGWTKPDILLSMITVAILLVIMVAFFLPSLQGIGVLLTAILIGSAIANMEIPYVAIIVIIALVIVAVVILIEEFVFQENRSKKSREKEGEKER